METTNIAGERLQFEDLQPALPPGGKERAQLLCASSGPELGLVLRTDGSLIISLTSEQAIELTPAQAQALTVFLRWAPTAIAEEELSHEHA